MCVKASLRNGLQTAKTKAEEKPKAEPKAKAVKAPKAKPAGLVRLQAPREGKADDLQEIEGIGPALEKLLNSLGFYHFDQLAAWTEADVALIDAEMKTFKGRITRDKWVEQSKIIVSNGLLATTPVTGSTGGIADWTSFWPDNFLRLLVGPQTGTNAGHYFDIKRAMYRPVKMTSAELNAAVLSLNSFVSA